MKKFFFILSLLFLSGTCFSQSYLISSGGTVTACSGDFFDSGNSGGNYGDSEDFTMTIHAPGPPNTHIKMIWNAFDVEPGDTLYIFDGSTIGAPLIGAYNNNNPLPSFTVASVYNVSGDLTFRFKSNASVTGAGFWGGFLCGPACQTVIAAIDTLECSPLPDDSNYIDICIGDMIHFAALGAGPGVFPQDNALYDQDSATTTFLWDFGDGTTATGRVVNHLYSLVRGYDVTLTVTDLNGCYNSNALGLRVRISANPYGEVHPLPDICSSNDTTYITLGYSLSSIITIEPIISVQAASQRFDSVMFIPDGPGCPPGCYSTEVTFNAFVPGSTISSGSDVLSVIVNIEHSFAGDLGFRLICPNGQSVVLDGNDHSGGAGLGIGYEPDGINACDPASNIQGTPWNYGWSQLYPTQGSLNVLDAMYGFPTGIPATDTIAQTGYLIPDQPFSNLIGCPLNGVWNIEICDNWGSDNGYIFMWELNLDPSLLPTGWSYSVPIDTVIWTGSFINIINDTTIMIIPDSGGFYNYTVTVIDEFGCSYDTTLSLQVVQSPEVDLGPDTTLCGNGLIYTLDAGQGDAYLWSTSASTQTIPVTSTGDYFVTVQNYNMGNTLTCSSADTVFVRVLALPFVDLGPDLCITDIPQVLDAGNPLGFQYQWYLNGSALPSETNQTYNAMGSGTYMASVAEEWGFGCESNDDVVLTYYPIPDLSVGPDSTICMHHTLEIIATDPNGYLSNFEYSYAWWPFLQTEPFITLTWLDPGVYNIICLVTGCNTVADTMLLTVEACDLTVPNIFTPNGDGYNETFKIPNAEYYPGSTIVIYNRWGRKVYENSSYVDQWSGEEHSDGVYYYIYVINYGDHGNGAETKEIHGTVTIMR